MTSISIMPKFIFVDLSDEFVDALNTRLSRAEAVIDYECRVQDIRELQQYSDTAFVSPANSMGFMDGGIDYVLSRRMFPNVEGQVKHAIAQLGLVNRLGRKFLPIGSCLIVPAEPTKNQYLISAPTMLLPQNINGTRNAYHAMYSLVLLVKKYNAYLQAQNRPTIKNIVCPGLGTGVGRLTAEDSAAQITKALEDFIIGSPTHDPDLSTLPHCVIRNPNGILQEQPKFYQNTEFYQIKPEDLVSIH